MPNNPAKKIPVLYATRIFLIYKYFIDRFIFFCRKYAAASGTG
jgi:hypothetical protein